MSLRKIAGLLAVFGLTVGLIGGGVGAVFTDQVKANENIAVGTFQCLIVAPSDGTIAADGKSVTYTAPTIQSSAPGSAPFSFTVLNNGSINAVLTITESPALTLPFSYIPLAPASPMNLAAATSQTFAAGVQWAELTNTQLGATGTVTWTVDCVDRAAGPTVTFYSVDRGSYGGQDSVKFAGAGTGFTPGDTIDVQYAWDAQGPFDLAAYWGYVNETAPVADANGAFTYWFADNCHDGQNYTTDQTATVTATDQHAVTATGTGILACSLMQ